MMTPERENEIRSIPERTLLPIHVVIAVEELLAELDRVRELAVMLVTDKELFLTSEIDQLRAKLDVAAEALECAKNQLWHNFDFLCSISKKDYAKHTEDVYELVKQALAKIRGEK